MQAPSFKLIAKIYLAIVLGIVGLFIGLFIIQWLSTYGLIVLWFGLPFIGAMLYWVFVGGCINWIIRANVRAELEDLKRKENK